MGASIANGEPALGSIEVERGPVLYCALEDNPHARLIIIDTFEKIRGTETPGSNIYAADYAAPAMASAGPSTARGYHESYRSAPRPKDADLN